MKIKVTKEQAMILENLKTPKVIKITEEQYRELLNLESNAYPSITRAFGKQAGEFKHNVSKLSKGVVYEESENTWKEFINELYGLNESGTNIYESLIKIMETVGYVKERKLCKEVFNNDKELAKEIISRGLYEFKESGSPYMAMEAMDNEHKKIIDSLKQQLTQKSTTKTSDEDIRKEIARRREIELNDRLKKNIPGDISEIEGEESQEMTDEIDTINMDVPLFIRALEFSREDAKSDLTLHEIAENAIRLTKEYGTLSMDNYYDIFGDDTQTNTDSVEEPNLTEYDDNLPMGTRDRKDAPWNEPDETEEPVNVNKDWDVLKFDEVNNSIILKSRRNNNEYALNIDIIPETLSDEINFSDINRTDWRSSLYGDRSKSIIANFVSDNLKDLVLPKNYGEGNPSDLFMDGKIFVKVIDTVDEVTSTGSALGTTSLVTPLGSKPEDYIIKKKIKENDEMYNYISDELGLTSDEFDEALNQSMAELDIIERIYNSDSYTREEALSIISNILKLGNNPQNQKSIEESGGIGSVGAYDTPGFPPSKFMGTSGKKGKAPVNKGVTHKKTTIPGGTFIKESAFDETQWAGGEFVEFDDCTKLNNNKEAQNGGCSTGAIDNVVKLKKSKSNVNAPSLKK
jgi:uncharacterized membrane-anchored protein YjiN (DUF445 family)